jgi:RNA polymerase sigma-70 factor, ECF subfamily
MEAAVKSWRIFFQVAEETTMSAQLMVVKSEEVIGSGPAASPGVHRDMGMPSDKELLEKVGAGDGSAFGELMDRHADRLFRLAVSLVGNTADAEDVVQETLAGAFRGAKKFEGRSSVKTWLTRIALTQAARWQRDQRRRRDKRRVATESMQVDEGPRARIDAKIDLTAALQRLTSEHREVLVLREFEMLPYEEMATLLGVPVGTIESRLFRARRELKILLGDYVP